MDKDKMEQKTSAVARDPHILEPQRHNLKRKNCSSGDTSHSP